MIRSTLLLFTFAFVAAVPALAMERVSVAPFHSVQLRGGGSVTVIPGPVQSVAILEGSSRFTHIYVDRDRQLKIDNCAVPCPRNYRLRVQIQTPSAPALAISGGGEMIAANGFAAQPELAVAVNGGGRLDARAIAATHVSAAVNGGGELLVRPRAAMAAAVRGGGAIRYWGNPVVTQVVSGGGAVLHAD